MDLKDADIIDLKDALIRPFRAERVQPASYDLELHPDILIPVAYKRIDLRTDRPGDHMRKVTMDDRGYELEPGYAILACTSESIHLPNDMKARVEGKSTLGRVFLAVHVTAGFVDPGWNGRITLEIVNHGPWTVVLWPGMPIAQVNFTRLDGPCLRPYGSKGLGSHYQGNESATAAQGERAKEAVADAGV